MCLNLTDVATHVEHLAEDPSVLFSALQMFLNKRMFCFNLDLWITFFLVELNIFLAFINYCSKDLMNLICTLIIVLIWSKCTCCKYIFHSCDIFKYLLNSFFFNANLLNIRQTSTFLKEKGLMTQNKLLKTERRLLYSRHTPQNNFNCFCKSHISRNTNSPFGWFWILTVRVYPVFFLGNWIFQNSWL